MKHGRLSTRITSLAALVRDVPGELPQDVRTQVSNLLEDYREQVDAVAQLVDAVAQLAKLRSEAEKAYLDHAGLVGKLREISRTHEIIAGEPTWINRVFEIYSPEHAAKAEAYEQAAKLVEEYRDSLKQLL